MPKQPPPDFWNIIRRLFWIAPKSAAPPTGTQLAANAAFDALGCLLYPFASCALLIALLLLAALIGACFRYPFFGVLVIGGIGTALIAFNKAKR
jgi:hypothetical protein